MKSELSRPKVVLDTKPLIKLFAQEEGWDAVQKIAAMVEAGEVEAAISVVTLTEIYYKYLQEKRADLAKSRTEDLRHAIYLEKLEIGEEAAIKAGEFKGKYGVSIADAFIAASAYLEGSTVISDDADFKRISEVKTYTEKEFISHLS
ncbi:MAG: type II toxin-antitoxin system VapC family toxin [Candidatus Bathyarchaeia archaeon]